MGIALQEGRGIGSGDLLEGRPGVAVINQSMARKYWPAKSPLGQVLRIGGQSFEVVGVAQDIKHRDLRSRSGPVFYIPFTRFPRAKAFVVLRTASRPEGLIAGLQAQIWAQDREQPIARIEEMSRLITEFVFGYAVLHPLDGRLRRPGCFPVPGRILHCRCLSSKAAQKGIRHPYGSWRRTMADPGTRAGPCDQHGSLRRLFGVGGNCRPDSRANPTCGSLIVRPMNGHDPGSPRSGNV